MVRLIPSQFLAIDVVRFLSHCECTMALVHKRGQNAADDTPTSREAAPLPRRATAAASRTFSLVTCDCATGVGPEGVAASAASSGLLGQGHTVHLRISNLRPSAGATWLGHCFTAVTSHARPGAGLNRTEACAPLPCGRVCACGCSFERDSFVVFVYSRSLFCNSSRSHPSPGAATAQLHRQGGVRSTATANNES